MQEATDLIVRTLGNTTDGSGESAVLSGVSRLAVDAESDVGYLVRDKAKRDERSGNSRVTFPSLPL